MKLIAVCTRYPEDLHGKLPYIIGEQGEKRIILIDADVDGFQRISMEEAANLVGEEAITDAQRIA